LIQTIGRAARNVNGKVIMYADNITNSMENAIYETDRRREIQVKYNLENNITPKTINKTISDILYNRGIRTGKETKPEMKVSEERKKFGEGKLQNMKPSEIAVVISGLEEEMYIAARELNFEEAAAIRDEIKRIKKITSIEI